MEKWNADNLVTDSKSNKTIESKSKKNCMGSRYNDNIYIIWFIDSKLDSHKLAEITTYISAAQVKMFIVMLRTFVLLNIFVKTMTCYNTNMRKNCISTLLKLLWLPTFFQTSSLLCSVELVIYDDRIKNFGQTMLFKKWRENWNISNEFLSFWALPGIILISNPLATSLGSVK